jgi:hypothetical protein
MKSLFVAATIALTASADCDDDYATTIADVCDAEADPVDEASCVEDADTALAACELCVGYPSCRPDLSSF